MKTKIIATIIFVLALLQMSYSQNSLDIDRSKVLSVGSDFTPPASVGLMRGDFKQIDWKGLENKVIILDFFDTFCGTCISSMPKLQELQNKLADKIQIFNITWQDRPTMDKFFNENDYLKEHKVNLPVIYDDKELFSLFPHIGKPHVAIVYKGKVKAITFHRSINEENLLALIQKGSIDLPLKDDFGKGDLQSSSDSKVIAGTWISRYQDGVPIQALQIKRDSISGQTISSVYNRSVFISIINAWSIIKPPTYLRLPGRVVWKVRDSSIYEDFNKQGEEWIRKYGICYERRDFNHVSDSVQARAILNDLNSFFGLKTYYSTRVIDCIIVEPCAVKENPNLKITNGFKVTGSGGIGLMIEWSGKFPPVFDRVKSDKTLYTLGGFKNLEELNQQLEVYGVKAKYGREEMEVLVVEEN